MKERQTRQETIDKVRMSADIRLNSQQKAAAQYSGSAQNILVTAGAGCGKTRTIIARTSYLIRSGVNDQFRASILISLTGPP